MTSPASAPFQRRAPTKLVAAAAGAIVLLVAATERGDIAAVRRRPIWANPVRALMTAIPGFILGQGCIGE